MHTDAITDVDATDRDTWLAWRRNGIGASDVGAIIGLSPWSSPWSLWAEKVGLLPSDENPTEAMEFGRYAELMVVPWVQDRLGLHVAGVQLACEHPDDPLARATLDGTLADGPNSEPIEGLEIKAEGPGKAWDGIPAHYQAQAQWQMYVTGLERVRFAVLKGRRLDVELVLERDDADIAYLVEQAHDFWAEYVATGVQPPTDGHQATLDALAAVYPHHLPDSSVAVDHLVEQLEQLAAAKADIKVAQLREREAKAALQAALGDAEIGTVAGMRAVSWKTQSRAGVDLDALRAAHPEICEEFATTTEFRVLRTHQ